MIVHDCEQRTDAWFQSRLGHFTASSAGDMLATIKTGEAAARRDLRLKLVLERITGTSQEGGFVSADMQRGTEMEPVALAAYEALSGNLTRKVGFVAHDSLLAGCSPDGVVGDFIGGLELKCPKSATHLGYLRGQSLPKEYVGQITHTLWLTGAQWWDFASFDDRFPLPLQLFCVRVMRDETAMQAYELMARQFLAEVDRDVAEVTALAGAA